jgi:hypothetical protein
MVLLLALAVLLGYRLILPLEEELLGRISGDAFNKMYLHRTHRYFGRPKRDVAE